MAADLMAALSTIAAIAGIGAAGNALLGAFKKPKAPPPASLLAPPPDPTKDMGQIAERNRVGARRIRAGSLYTPPPTLLTGAGGLPAPAPTALSTVLGR